MDPGAAPFLPTTLAEARARGWDELDVVLVTPDAYVDHPAFGAAVIGRVLEAQGLRVGVLAQPDWRSLDSFRTLGRPRLFFGVSGGNVDSMLARYTAARKQRNDDPYAPGGQAGFRPERATIVYAAKLREAWPGAPLVLGGIEASLRRFAHYDFWENRVRKPLLVDTPACLAVYGMGERAAVAVAARLAAGEPLEAVLDVPGTVVKAKEPPSDRPVRELPPAEEVAASKDAFARATVMIQESRTSRRDYVLAQRAQNWWVLENPPPEPMTPAELDAVYDLPYRRRWHPSYDQAGGVPALETVQSSIVSHRGCFGDCAFCTLALHQGKVVQARSPRSIVAEARRLAAQPGFKGRINDVGGPTANMYGIRCRRHGTPGWCSDRRCLAPEPCRHLDPSHRAWLDVLDQVLHVPGIKSVSIGSGCRHDLLLLDRQALRTVVGRHVAGQMKVAPEHLVDEVVAAMGKPSGDVYARFHEAFFRACHEAGREQYLVPYLMSSHPGCTLDHMVQLLQRLTEEWRYFPEQVQDFQPTPMSLATAMFWLGFDPATKEPIFVARSPHEKSLQRALMQPRLPKNRHLVMEALRKTPTGRMLLESGEACRLWPFLFSGGSSPRFDRRPSDRHARPPRRDAPSRRGGRAPSRSR